ncbi:MAG TPA: glycosyltransferase [Gemmatimonadaceae bacterium]|nr:glycosyltransferase [Gemmatimonadaceae bacterium]
MKVLHVIPSVSLADGGPSVAIGELAAAMGQAGADVTVATTDADGPGRLDVPIGEPVPGPGGVTYWHFRHHLSGWKFSVGLTRWLAANVAAYDVVEVHALFSYATIPACRLARRAGVPYVIRPLGTLDAWSLRHRRWKKAPYFAAVERRHLTRAAGIHCTSDAEAAAVRALGFGDLAWVVPLGVTPGPSAAPRPGRGRRILYLARLHPKKGLPLLIDAMARLGSDLADAELVVAGAGDPGYEERLRGQARAAGVAERVRFVGHVTGAEKARLLAEADVFVLPSSQENFGLSATEAMAAGVPVILSEAVAVAGAACDAGAALVAARDAGAIADALARVLRDGELRRAMSERAAAFARRHYSWDRAAAALLQRFAALPRTGAARTPAPAGA